MSFFGARLHLPRLRCRRSVPPAAAIQPAAADEQAGDSRRDKEVEGNPQIKARIRRMQRDLRAAPHDAGGPDGDRGHREPDALTPSPSIHASSRRRAPMVVAKGKNYLALRIREKRDRAQIPIVENPPLAQALYKSAKSGRRSRPTLPRRRRDPGLHLPLMNGRLPGDDHLRTSHDRGPVRPPPAGALRCGQKDRVQPAPDLGRRSKHLSESPSRWRCWGS